MARRAGVRVPASSANLGPGFDVLALALDLPLEVRAEETSRSIIRWEGEGGADIPLGSRNLIVRAAQEPFARWDRPLRGLTLEVRNAIPIGRGLGSSAAAIVAGITIGAKLRGLRMPPQRILDLGLPLEGHGDNLAAAIFGGFCVVASGEDGSRVHRLDWPARWRAVLFIPSEVSPTEEGRRLVPARVPRADVVHNLGRVAEWVVAVKTSNRAMLAGAMEDRLHQPGRSRAYPYLNDMMAAARQAGALGAALSGAGGSVIAIADRQLEPIGKAMRGVADEYHLAGRTLQLRGSKEGASTLDVARPS
ncbi:MAG: homoserine kinase [Candidatus Dormibacter sp.]